MPRKDSQDGWASVMAAEIEELKQTIASLTGEVDRLRQSHQPTVVAVADNTPHWPYGKHLIISVTLLGAIIAVAVTLRAISTPSTPGTAAAAPTAAVGAQGPAVGISAVRKLVLWGSNTIGAELAGAEVEGFMRSRGITRVEHLAGPGQYESRVSGLSENGARMLVTIQAAGSATGFVALASHAADIAMSSRRITAAEAGMLSNVGEMVSPASERIIGNDAVVIITNRQNPVVSMSIETLARVLVCDITDWKDVGGQPGAIHLYRRNDDSGTYQLLKDLVLGGREVCAKATTITDSRELSAKVTADPNALGFIGYPYIGKNRALAIRDGDAPAVAADPLTIGTEEYPLCRRLYLYVPRDPVNPLASEFIRFVEGDGQASVSQSGFVGLNILAMPGTIRPDAPDEYRALVRSAERLNVDLRFDTGRSMLDSKAAKDIERVSEFMRELQNGPKRVSVAGFADSSGPRAANCRLAQERAETIASELARGHVAIDTVQGFCDDLQVGSSLTVVGRERSRRAELFLR